MSIFSKVRVSTLLSAVLMLQALPALSAGSSLHPGDKLNVIIYNHPELASQPTIDGVGGVSLPLVGVLNARSLTPTAFARKIERSLKRYVIHPAVDVQVLTPGNSLFVVGPLGAVLTYVPGETLISALSQASLQQAAPPSETTTVASSTTASSSSATIGLRVLRESGVDLRNVVIQRDGMKMQPVNVEACVEAGESGPVLAAGDTIALHVRPVAVKVTGEVAHPVTAHLYPDEPLLNAVRQAGGANDTTAGFRFQLQRNGVETVISTTSPELYAPAQPGDSITVPRALRIIVAGNVFKPGTTYVQGDQTLLSALYTAGGPQEYGDIAHVSVIHQGKKATYDVTRTKDGMLSENPLLADGDAVFVPTSHRINFATVFQGVLAAASIRRI